MSKKFPLRSTLMIGLLIIIIIYMLSTIDSFEPSSNTVAVIPITGIITSGSEGGFGSTTASSTDIVRYIEDANEDDDIKMIVFEINSPGGSAVASDEIVQAVGLVDKPTLAWIRESGASGAYWVASKADYIIANRMSITGSVGVLASYLEFGGFLKDHNITYRRITGGEYKDIGSPLSELTPTQKLLLQKKIDLIHSFFLKDVQENRNLTDDQLSQIESGIFFIGAEAYELGLVDELGGRNEVKEYVERMVGEDPVYKRYEKPRSFISDLLGVKSSFDILIPDLSIDAR